MHILDFIFRERYAPLQHARPPSTTASELDGPSAMPSPPSPQNQQQQRASASPSGPSNLPAYIQLLQPRVPLRDAVKRPTESSPASTAGDSASQASAPSRFPPRSATFATSAFAAEAVNQGIHKAPLDSSAPSPVSTPTPAGHQAAAPTTSPIQPPPPHVTVDLTGPPPTPMPQLPPPSARASPDAAPSSSSSGAGGEGGGDDGPASVGLRAACRSRACAGVVDHFRRALQSPATAAGAGVDHPQRLQLLVDSSLGDAGPEAAASASATGTSCGGDGDVSSGGGGVDCPPDTQQLGRATWTFLHSVAAHYPERPTGRQRELMAGMMAALAELYPCEVCAEHLREQVRRSPPPVDSARELNLWLCGIHNEVNEMLGKPLFDCEQVAERWRDGPPDGACD